MSKMNDGDWRSRVASVREGAPKRERNDYVSDLWANRGWGDDDFFAADPAATQGLGQEPLVRLPNRGHYNRQHNENRFNARAVGEKTAQRAITAHGMVQSFISAFSDEHGYRVVFSLNTPAPAATIFEQKLVLVDPSPIFDKTISATQCGLVMTALAVHEVSHIDFDRHHGEEVERQVPKTKKALALRVSNILSDRRIELRFGAKFPGYSDVFDPALEYICRPHHGRVITFDPADPGNLVVAAIRYAKWLDWSAPGMQVEQYWWDDLANRAAQSDDVQWHVDHVKEGLKRLANLAKNAPPPPPEPHPFKP